MLILAAYHGDKLRVTTDGGAVLVAGLSGAGRLRGADGLEDSPQKGMLASKIIYLEVHV